MTTITPPKPSLFRPEVLIHKKSKNLGTVCINTPTRYQVIAVGYSLITIGIILFLMFAEFPEKTVVNGYVEASSGTSTIYPNKNGVVTKTYVQSGKIVHKGEPLFMVDTSFDGSNAQASKILNQLLARKLMIEQEIKRSQQELNAMKQLVDKKYMALAAYNQKHEALTQLKTSKNLLEVDIIKFKQENVYVIHSPIDGKITNVVYQAGQSVNVTKPIVKIIPLNQQLIAELFIPLRHANFLDKTNHVLINYDAYPASRFGHYAAHIHKMSQSPLTDEEDDKPIRIGQPYYKVFATLSNQYVSFYGQKKYLTPGMTFTATIIGSKKKVWQWILDPLYSVYGRLM